MIGKLTGTLLEKNPPEVLLDCHGVGYEVNVPMSTFYNLPAVGERVSLLTQFIVREDAQLLYGFATAPERQAFRELIKISGVGPRTALSILSGMGVSDLAQAISLQEAVFAAMDEALAPGGVFATFGYLQSLVLPGAQSLRRRLRRLSSRSTTKGARRYARFESTSR